MNKSNSSCTFINRHRVLLLIVSSILLSTTKSIKSYAAASPPPSEFPESITIRAGVLHAPPFAIVNENDSTGSTTFSGFQIDLIERAKIFAANDGVELNMILDVAPTQYTAAFDLVANDCSTTVAAATAECDKFDLIVADFYATPVRSLRATLSPAWLRSTIGTLRNIHYNKGAPEANISTLAQASEARASVCIKDGTFYSQAVMEKYPNANYVMCNSLEDCVDLLKQQKCVLYPDDELMLRYQQINDPDNVQLTREHFNTQYIVWPMNFNMDSTSVFLLKRWIYSALVNETLDELYYTYFEEKPCPYGTAGKNCELFCHPDHGVADLEGICVCESTKWTGDDCSIEVKEDFNFIPPTLKILGYVMFGINVSVVIFCTIWLCVNRRTAQVHVSQPSFLLLVLLGCFISSSTILVLAHEDNTVPGNDNADLACMAIPWTYSIGFSITFGSLFAKIRRVHKIFKSAANMKRTVVSISETLSVIAVVLFIDFAVLMTWTIVDPLHWQREVIMASIFGEPLESVGYCTCEHWQIFCAIIATLHFCLLGIASYLCYETRHISTNFSQGKYVAIAMVSNLQIFVVGIPVLVIVGSDSDTGFFVRSVIIWMNDLVVVVLIFGSLICSVYKAPNASLEQTIQNATRDYISNSNQNLSREITTEQRSRSNNIHIMESDRTMTSHNHNGNIIDGTSTTSWLRCQVSESDRTSSHHHNANIIDATTTARSWLRSQVPDD